MAEGRPNFDSQLKEASSALKLIAEVEKIIKRLQDLGLTREAAIKTGCEISHIQIEDGDIAPAPARKPRRKAGRRATTKKAKKSKR